MAVIEGRDIVKFYGGMRALDNVTLTVEKGDFHQLYREEARYLERTAPWVERVGLPHIRQQIVEDAANRQALYQRLLASQQVSQEDPWAERAAPEHRLEFVAKNS